VRAARADPAGPLSRRTVLQPVLQLLRRLGELLQRRTAAGEEPPVPPSTLCQLLPRLSPLASNPLAAVQLGGASRPLLDSLAARGFAGCGPDDLTALLEVGGRYSASFHPNMQCASSLAAQLEPELPSELACCVAAQGASGLLLFQAAREDGQWNQALCAASLPHLRSEHTSLGG
jgi:hypothetical protein